MATKRDIFEEHLEAWLKARNNRKKRGEITRYIVFITKMHPGSVSRKFKRIQMRDPLKESHPGRRAYYTPDVDAALKDVWDAGDEMCGELLHPVIAEYVAIMRRDGQWRHSDEATEKLLMMSERTVKRRLTHFERARGKRRGLSSTKPSSLKSIIPIFKGPWRELPPGHKQIDTLAHCGTTLLGDFIYTVSATDAATYWMQSRAQWNKGEEATVASLDCISEKSPFPDIEYHPDSGSEFINWTLKKYCDKRSIKLSRSEPGKKNDNMYIEERNGHVIRKFLGYDRFDCRAIVSIMNELYDVLDLYLNHFKPVRRQLSKEKVGSKYVRRYEKKARSPYARVLAHKNISDETKEKLRALHAKLNPLVLKKKIDTLLSMITSQQLRHKTRNCRCSFH